MASSPYVNAPTNFNMEVDVDSIDTKTERGVGEKGNRPVTQLFVHVLSRTLTRPDKLPAVGNCHGSNTGCSDAVEHGRHHPRYHEQSMTSSMQAKYGHRQLWLEPFAEGSKRNLIFLGDSLSPLIKKWRRTAANIYSCLSNSLVKYQLWVQLFTEQLADMALPLSLITVVALLGISNSLQTGL
ncbi:unnamed protein product [Fusarium graminearum]|nr:unnamed protein product [Fusarium graminearum]